MDFQRAASAACIGTFREIRADAQHRAGGAIVAEQHSLQADAVAAVTHRVEVLRSLAPPSGAEDEVTTLLSHEDARAARVDADPSLLNDPELFADPVAEDLGLDRCEHDRYAMDAHGKQYVWGCDNPSAFVATQAVDGGPASPTLAGLASDEVAKWGGGAEVFDAPPEGGVDAVVVVIPHISIPAVEAVITGRQTPRGWVLDRAEVCSPS